MLVRFWGTRGSIPTPGPRTATYGGNTSCVEVRADDGTCIIFDCGTGARELGQHLLSAGRPAAGGLRLHLFIGHTHWDHIQGFPFFVPAFLPDSELNIYAAAGFQRSLEEALAGQMQYSYFPVRLKELRSHLNFTELEEGFFRVGDVLVETQHLNHTNPTMAYRITADGASVAYTTDHEPFWTPGGLDFRHPGDQRHVAFLSGADLVIHDAQYTEAEYPQRLGWGHSTIEYATDVAMAGQAARLALFHHDPTRDDAAVERMEAQARARVAAQHSPLEVFAAAEGLTLELRGERGRPEVPSLSALWRRPITGKRVLVVGGTEAEVGAIAQELEEDQLVLVRAPSKLAALASVEGAAPDLAIVDSRLPEGAGSDLIQPLRDRSGRGALPILLLTDDPGATPPHANTGATDYLAKPFSPPMLRSRVRAWLARAAAETGPGKVAAPPRAPDRRSGRIVLRTDKKKSLLEAIASVPVFQALNRSQLQTLARRASLQIFEAGREIVRADAPPDLLFLLVSGRARVFAPADELLQSELVLAELGRGEVFGEIGILADRPRSATVVAVERTQCLVVPASDFSAVLQAAPNLCLALLQVLARRIYDTDRRLARYAPDPLTGLPRRRAFYDQYPHLAAQADRTGSKLLLGLLDIVNLKAINDRFGYGAGDEVVRTVADALRDSARRSDLVARYGGDEFVVLLVGAKPNTIDVIAERVRSRLAELAPVRGLPVTVECAVGVAIADVPPEGPDKLLLQADQDMQRKKSARC